MKAGQVVDVISTLNSTCVQSWKRVVLIFLLEKLLEKLFEIFNIEELRQLQYHKELADKCTERTNIIDVIKELLYLDF